MLAYRMFCVSRIALMPCSLCLMMMSPSLKQSGIHSGNPWPPYKERTPLHPCYKGLIKLLHCKTLHIVIFTLLYKVSPSTSVSYIYTHAHTYFFQILLFFLGFINFKLTLEGDHFQNNMHYCIFSKVIDI